MTRTVPGYRPLIDFITPCTMTNGPRSGLVVAVYDRANKPRGLRVKGRGIGGTTNLGNVHRSVHRNSWNSRTNTGDTGTMKKVYTPTYKRVHRLIRFLGFYTGMFLRFQFSYDRILSASNSLTGEFFTLSSISL